MLAECTDAELVGIVQCVNENHALGQREPMFPAVACLVGKGPSVDSTNWDYILGQTECFGWVNETWQLGVYLGLPISAAFAQDVEALQLISSVPADTWICTQKSQYHRGNNPRFAFRAPWYQFPDRQGTGNKMLGLCTAPNAIHVMAAHGVQKLHMVGFDSCNWDEARLSDTERPFYSRQVLNLGHDWTVNANVGSWRAYRMIAKEIHQAIADTGVTPVWHDLRGGL